jgi:hypothetical protein
LKTGQLPKKLSIIAQEMSVRLRDKVKHSWR